MYQANSKWQATTLPLIVYKLIFITRAMPGILLVYISQSPAFDMFSYSC